MNGIVQKYFLIVGGFWGFTLTLIVGFLAKNEMVIVLQNASVGCIVGAFLGKLLQWVIEIHRASIKDSFEPVSKESVSEFEEGKRSE